MPNRTRRHSTVTIHGLDGTYTGDGENLAQGGGYVNPEWRYTLTAKGALALCVWRTAAYLADDSVEAAVKMEAAYRAAERLEEGQS